MRLAAILSPPSSLSLERNARKRVSDFLEALHKVKQPVTALTYEEAMTRADLAASFVEHPYWAIMGKMLSGTIQAETEQLLSGDDHKEVNRASVAMCRKLLQMPFFDIEQGQLAQREYLKAQALSARRRATQSGIAPHEVQ